MRNYRSNTNRLANLKNNTVVRQAIQRDKDIKTTQRSTNFGYAAASLLIPGGFLTGIGGKAIGQAFKKAGSLLKNTRSPNTTSSKALQDATLADFKKGYHSKTGIKEGKRYDSKMNKVMTKYKNNPDEFMDVSTPSNFNKAQKYFVKKDTLLFKNQSLKDFIDAANKAARNKSKKPK